MARRNARVDHHPAMFFYPLYQPGMTWGLGNGGAAYTPGPGGPQPDPRPNMVPPPNPIYGRVGPLSILRAFGPTIGEWRPWGMVGGFNNAWAPYIPELFVPGWAKGPASPTSGF